MADYWTPRFQYPVAGTTLTLTRSMRYWRAHKFVEGGKRIAAAGGVNRAGRTIRTEYLLDIVLRIQESERGAVETMHQWMANNFATPFTFWPDTGVSGTSYSALLVSPAHGEELDFPRSDFPSDLEVSLTLIRSDGAAWGSALLWYPD